MRIEVEFRRLWNSFLGRRPRQDYFTYWGWSQLDFLDGHVFPRIFHEMVGEAKALPFELFHEYKQPLSKFDPNEHLGRAQKEVLADGSCSFTFYDAKDAKYSLSLGHLAFENTQYTEVYGTVARELIARDSVRASTVNLLKKCATIMDAEYLFAVEQDRISAVYEEGRACVVRDCVVPMYTHKPARHLPLMPWVLVLGRKYIDFFGEARLNALEGQEHSFIDDGHFCIISVDNPCIDQAKREGIEVANKHVLGEDAFFQPTDPLGVAKGPEYRRVHKYMQDEPVGSK